MKDRIPRNPGRMLVTPEAGGEAYYVSLTRADNPEQEGTPLNRATLLSTATAEKLGLDPEAATPSDALAGVCTFLTAVLPAAGWTGTPNMTKALNAVYAETDTAGTYTLVMPEGWVYAADTELAFDVPEAVTAATTVSVQIGEAVYALSALPTWAAGDVAVVKLLTESTAETSTTAYKEGGPYTQTASVTGLLATDTPLADVALTEGDVAAMEAELAAWGNVSLLKALDGQLYGKCISGKPEADLNIQLKVVR